MKVTMILVLSIYDGKNPQSDYESDCGTVSGAQTNEAPVKYAIKRLAEDGKKLTRIIAVTTERARKTALEMFTNSINAVSPDTEIIPVDIENNEDATNLLKKTLEKLIPLDEDEAVVMETTGGFRNTTNFLSLVSRFLHLNGTKILFSTYADFHSAQKCVKDTSESDKLHDLIEALNVFTATSNPELLIERVNLSQIPNAQALCNALNDYYEMLLFYKISKYEKTIKQLRDNLNTLLGNNFINAFDISGLLFRDVLRQTLMKKTPFIFEEHMARSLKMFIEWCLDNNYIAQAVIILMQKFISEQNVGRNNIFERIRIYRNDISHTDWYEDNDMLQIPDFFYGLSYSLNEINTIRKQANVSTIKRDVRKALELIDIDNIIITT